MNATLTLVLCLMAEPERCEVHDLRVDAQACFYGGANVIREHTPAGWMVQSARCLPAHLGNLRGAGSPPTGRPPERPASGVTGDG